MSGVFEWALESVVKKIADFVYHFVLEKIWHAWLDLIGPLLAQSILGWMMEGARSFVAGILS